MATTLLTAASGLLSHQRKLDVVANNLANLNTVGFKTQRVIFSDLMYETIQPSTAATTPGFGGTNPMQVGSGVRVSQIARKFTQGNLEATGALFDFALQGEGFFVVADSTTNWYTRAGSFSLDSNGNLVDPATGLLVQRTGTYGEETNETVGFQTPGDSSINIPLGTLIAGEQTTFAQFSGNLPASALPPQTERLITASQFETKDGSPITAATLLNNLASNTVEYQAGDEISISGTNPDGTSFGVALAVGPTTTLNDVINQLNTVLVGAQASFEPEGNLVITADSEGEAFTSVFLEDTATNVGQSDFLQHAFTVQTAGTSGDTFETSIEVFDSRGQDHGLRLSFTKTTFNTWDVEVALNDDTGVEIDSQVMGLRFQEDGSFSFVSGVDDGDASIELNFDSLAENQSIELSFDNLNHFATDFGLAFEQDGFGAGSLVSVGLGADGTLDGIATNGKRIPLAQLAIAKFNVPEALNSEGNNYFSETGNSGEVQIGTGLSNGRGRIFGGQLESSNVDIALEFTHLIVAQRGFSANARTITVADEVLEELTNIVR